jgi:valyl-tRNA synthetase
MPFLTEELWQRLGMPGKSIALAEYPVRDSPADDVAESDMSALQDLVLLIRQSRADNKVEARQTVDVEIAAPDESQTFFRENFDAISRLAKANLTLNGPQPGFSYTGPPNRRMSMTVGVRVDRERVSKEIAELEKVVANSQRQLSNESFIAKAPEKIVAGMRQKQAEYEAQLAKLRATL